MNSIGRNITPLIKVKDMILKEAIDERRERNAEALAVSCSDCSRAHADRIFSAIFESVQACE